MTSIYPTAQKIIKRYLKRNGELPSSEYVARKLEKDHSDLVERYIASHRTTLIKGVITRSMANERNALRQAELTKRLISGVSDSVFDLEQFWSTAFFVPGDGWKSLGNLTGADHAQIATKYEMLEEASRARAELHRELADKVGDSTTREVFQPTQLVSRIQLAYDTQAQLTNGGK